MVSGFECDRSWVTKNCICGVMVSVLASVSVIDHGLQKTASVV